MWPVDPQELMALQVELAAATTEPGRPPVDPSVAACWVSFPRGLTGRGGPGDPAWTAAVTMHRGRGMARHEERVGAGAAYVPGLLALRLGPMCEAAVRALWPVPDVVLVDATGRDHPRHGGLALHLGAALDLPSVGVTHRPLLARGDWPADKTGAVSPLVLDGVVVGYWLRTRAGMRPIASACGLANRPRDSHGHRARGAARTALVDRSGSCASNVRGPLTLSTGSKRHAIVDCCGVKETSRRSRRDGRDEDFVRQEARPDLDGR